MRTIIYDYNNTTLYFIDDNIYNNNDNIQRWCIKWNYSRYENDEKLITVTI